MTHPKSLTAIPIPRAVGAARPGSNGLPPSPEQVVGCAYAGIGAARADSTATIMNFLLMVNEFGASRVTPVKRARRSRNHLQLEAVTIVTE
jgi:hypothetical protein